MGHGSYFFSEVAYSSAMMCVQSVTQYLIDISKFFKKLVLIYTFKLWKMWETNCILKIGFGNIIIVCDFVAKNDLWKAQKNSKIFALNNLFRICLTKHFIEIPLLC